MLLCVGSINTFLINKKLRGYVSINAQSGEAMDTHSFATLIGVDKIKKDLIPYYECI